MGRRGTTNGNVRGNTKDRAARRHFLLVTFGLPGLPGITKCHVETCSAWLDYFSVTVDRIVPGCQGGTYRRSNIRPACGYHNSEMGGRIRSSITPSERKVRDMKIDEQVRQMHPPRYTRAQAAALVGRDSDTLKRWKRDGVFAPSDSKPFGQIVVDLYTDEDITTMRKIARSIKPGRRPAQSA